MKSFLVYSVLSIGMLGSALMAVAGAFAALNGGDTIILSGLFALNTVLLGSCAREYTRS